MRLFAVSCRMVPAAAVFGLMTAASSSAAVIYDSEAAFVGALDSYLYSDFEGLSATPKTISDSGNGFSYTIRDSDHAGDPGIPDGLFSVTVNGSGAISTNLAEDSLRIDFDENLPLAVGGNMFGTGMFGDVLTTSIRVTLSDGTVEVFSHVGSGDHFVGFVSDAPIEWIEIAADPAADGNYRYPTLDNFYVGSSAVPEPGTATAALAAVGLLGFRRRRRGVTAA